MAQGVIAVAVAVPGHPVFHRLQLLHIPALHDSPQKMLQAAVHIPLAGLRLLVEGTGDRLGLILQNPLHMEQVHIFKLLHRSEKPHRQRSVFRRGNQSVFDTAEPPLNGLPPLGIPDVKGVRQDGDRNLAPGLPKQCLLQGPLGLLEPLSVAVGFLALIPVGKPLFLLLQGSGPLPALLDQIIPLVVYLIQGFLQPLLQLLQDLSRHLPAAHILQSLQGLVSHQAVDLLIFLPAGKSRQHMVPGPLVLLQQPFCLLQALQLLPDFSVVAGL